MTIPEWLLRLAGIPLGLMLVGSVLTVARICHCVLADRRAAKERGGHF